MDSILLIIAGIAALSLASIHLHGILKQRQTLWLTLFFDLVVGGLVLLALVRYSTFAAWMREDAWVEWATFYAFAAAGLVTLRWVYKHWRALLNDNLMALIAVLGIGLFCVFVAAEEISWGQRLFAFKPPNIFLEKNFQQELNVHNFFKNKEIAGFPLDSRFLVALVAVLYGLILMALARIIERGQLAVALSVAAPPMTLAPWFALVALVELSYPLKFTGEAAEFVLGLLFLSAALARDPWRVEHKQNVSCDTKVLTGLATVIVLGLVTPLTVQAIIYAGYEESIAQTRTELKELSQDFQQDGVITSRLMRKKSVHKRLFTAVHKGYLNPPAQSVFLQSKSSPKQLSGNQSSHLNRRSYFLDPWNNPYWIYYNKRKGRILLYSFGPNRRRDTDLIAGNLSSEPLFQGDDIGVIVTVDR